MLEPVRAMGGQVSLLGVELGPACANARLRVKEGNPKADAQGESGGGYDPGQTVHRKSSQLMQSFSGQPANERGEGEPRRSMPQDHAWPGSWRCT